ncbi:OadG family protein [Desulfobacter sp.]|uniref:OadG family protein n=1 Tax=Desulfobacter sp. TaxID=2294 RepID=UPI003D13B9BA
MKKIQKASFLSTGLCVLILLGFTPALAAFGEDVEKPKPVFTRDGDAVTAKLLPRGKSTSVTVRFAADSGRVADVQAVDFASVKDDGIDRKDFRCDLFSVLLENISPGDEVTLTAGSDFFSSSTRFFLYNSGASPAWTDTGANQKAYPDRVRELAFTIRDGGPYDTDGAADGKILLICGPCDSFWGYAIGTLFIRFFGVFLVLGVLMFGMIVCGKIFESAYKRKAAKVEETKLQPTVSAPRPVSAASEMEPEMVAAVAMRSGNARYQCIRTEMEPEMVAAVAMALHLEMSGPVSIKSELGAEDNQNAWSLYGRQKIMSDRMQAFKRHFNA